MKQAQNNVCHHGTVQKINHDSIHVLIHSQSACASCQIKGVCNISEQKDKIIEVNKKNTSGLKEGDLVMVTMSGSLGNKALFLGYLLPFILMVLALLAALFVQDNEGTAALISIGVLIPYYFVLSRFKDVFKKKFLFDIHRFQE